MKLRILCFCSAFFAFFLSAGGLLALDVSGEVLIEQVKEGMQLAEVQRKFGNPVFVKNVGEQTQMLHFVFDSKDIGYVSGFSITARDGFVLKMFPSTTYNPLIRENGTQYAEFPGGEQWKYGFDVYLEKARMTGPFEKLTDLDRSFLVNAILIPYTRLTPEQREAQKHEKVNTNCEIVKYLQSRLPKESQLDAKLVTVEQVLELAQKVKAQLKVDKQEEGDKKEKRVPPSNQK